MVRNIVKTKGHMVIEKWKRIHTKELFALYFSPNIIQVNKENIIRWEGNVAFMGDRRGAYSILVERLSEVGHLEDLGIDGKFILKWKLKKWNENAQTGPLRLSIRTGGGHL